MTNINGRGTYIHKLSTRTSAVRSVTPTLNAEFLAGVKAELEALKAKGGVQFISLREPDKIVEILKEQCFVCSRPSEKNLCTRDFCKKEYRRLQSIRDSYEYYHAKVKANFIPIPCPFCPTLLTKPHQKTCQNGSCKQAHATRRRQLEREARKSRGSKLASKN